MTSGGFYEPPMTESQRFAKKYGEERLRAKERRRMDAMRTLTKDVGFDRYDAARYACNGVQGVALCACFTGLMLAGPHLMRCPDKFEVCYDPEDWVLEKKMTRHGLVMPPDDDDEKDGGAPKTEDEPVRAQEHIPVAVAARRHSF